MARHHPDRAQQRSTIGADRTDTSGDAPTRGRTLDEPTVFAMALHVLEHDGIDELSLVHVAQRLGVTQPALYRHVGSLDHLLRCLALEGRRQLLAVLTDAAVARAGDDALRAIAAAWRRFATQHRDLYAVTDRSKLAGDAANEAAAAAIARLFARVIASFGIDALAAEQAAWSLRSALHGFVVLEADGGYPEHFDLDETFERFVSMLIAGIRTWDAPGT